MKPLADLIKQVIRDKSGIAEYILNGKEMVCAFTPLPGYNWILVQGAEKSEVVAQVTHMRNIMFIIGAICAALGIIVAIITGRSITCPLTRITEVVKHTGSGDDHVARSFGRAGNSP
jgi:methyl-accepting chemotaxis protein